MRLKSTVHILLTGAGSPAASGVIKSLHLSEDYEFHITCMDCNHEAAGLHMGDEHVVGPRADDDSFIPFVKQLCKHKMIDLIMSLVTAELIKLSEVEADFAKAGIRLNISSVPALKTAINKGELYEELNLAGIAVPEFRIVNSGDQIRDAVYQLGYPKRAVCLKPTVADGSRGFHILDPYKDRLHILLHEKPNSAYIGESDLFNLINNQTELPELIVMEYLPYEEYSVDILADKGEVLVAVPRLRQATVEGITVRSEIRKEDDILNYVSLVVKQLALQGIVGVQVRRDRNRQPKIVEINPRVQGTIIHCTAAGVNLPLLSVKQSFGRSISNEEVTIKWGTRMVRYWEEFFFDAQGFPL
jgi:carbamoyl-phosphate synthase large subunit